MTLRVLVGTVAVSLAGCSLQTSLTGGMSGPVGVTPNTSSQGGASGPSEASGSPNSGMTARERDAAADRHIPGNVDCSGDKRAAHLEKYGDSCDPREPVIVGLSVADAKKKIASTNAELKVKVIEQYEFDKDCKADHVCGFEPRRWYIAQSYEVTLRINRKLDIGPPAD
ncbi:MAG: hypothetical protein ACKV2T_21085 [Kofleriaceae bacterium]